MDIPPTGRGTAAGCHEDIQWRAATAATRKLDRRRAGYEGPGVNPTVPPALARFFDYGWFACLAVTEKFLPGKAPLKITYELDA